VNKIILDSDVIIEILRNNQSIKEKIHFLEETGCQICYTPIAKTEIYYGMRNGEEERIKAFFSNCFAIDITDDMGEIAGRYLNQYKKSHGTEITDVLIAAAAHVNKAALWTLNHKHYPMKDIKINK
jgi:predicted nucleic acid-binding protein